MAGVWDKCVFVDKPERNGNGDVGDSQLFPVHFPGSLEEQPFGVSS